MNPRRTPPTVSVRVPRDLVKIATIIAGERTAATGQHHTPAAVLADAARVQLARTTPRTPSEPPRAA